LAGIKQLVDQILFVSNVPGQQICDEQIGKGRFAVKRIHHGLFFNSQNSAIGHCVCRTHAEMLTCKRTFAEETPLTQYADRGFLAILGDDGESYLPCLQIKHCVGRIPLGEDGLLFRKEQNSPAFADGVEEHLGVEVGAVLGGWRWTSRIPRESRFLFNRRQDGDFRRTFGFAKRSHGHTSAHSLSPRSSILYRLCAHVILRHGVSGYSPSSAKMLEIWMTENALNFEKIAYNSS